MTSYRALPDGADFEDLSIRRVTLWRCAGMPAPKTTPTNSGSRLGWRHGTKPTIQTKRSVHTGNRLTRYSMAATRFTLCGVNTANWIALGSVIATTLAATVAGVSAGVAVVQAKRAKASKAAADHAQARAEQHAERATKAAEEAAAWQRQAAEAASDQPMPSRRRTSWSRTRLRRPRASLGDQVSRRLFVRRLEHHQHHQVRCAHRGCGRFAAQVR